MPVQIHEMPILRSGTDAEAWDSACNPCEVSKTIEPVYPQCAP